IVLGMADNVGRERLGRQSAAHGSARRERAANAPLTKRGRGRKGRGDVCESSSSQAQHEPKYKRQHVDEIEAEYAAEHGDAAHDEDDADISPPPPPPPSPPRVRNRRVRNKQPQPPPVDEVFGGGPTDLSVIPTYGKHIAARLWKGEYNQRTLKCMNNGKKVIDFVKPDANLEWFWSVVDASRLRPLLKTNYGQVDHGLLTAFTERWHSETGTFHLPLGELTITLDDVSCLLHLPIDGKMLIHVGTSLDQDESVDMCNEFLNFDQVECNREFDKLKGSHIGFVKLQQIYHENLNNALQAESNELPANVIERYRECTIRAFLLFLAWIMAHFQTISPREIDPLYNHVDPVAARFFPGKGHKYPHTYRTFLDRLEVDDCTFSPYDDHRQAHPFQDISWYTGWIMCGCSMVFPHLPERVLRQYGHVQSIPRDAVISARPLMNAFQIQHAFQDYLVKNYVTLQMRGPRVQSSWDSEPGYIAWIYSVSHPKLWPPVEGGPPRTANVEVLIEEDGARN
ncbi:putative IMP dehydrogenase/GMP reductase, partial [Trifolium medium]|nr:putative IMP dehydrogenase/GMP reductase [Trifolium medium]